MQVKENAFPNKNAYIDCRFTSHSDVIAICNSQSVFHDYALRPSSLSPLFHLVSKTNHPAAPGVLHHQRAERGLGTLA